MLRTRVACLSVGIALPLIVIATMFDWWTSNAADSEVEKHRKEPRLQENMVQEVDKFTDQEPSSSATVLSDRSDLGVLQRHVSTHRERAASNIVNGEMSDPSEIVRSTASASEVRNQRLSVAKRLPVPSSRPSIGGGVSRQESQDPLKEQATALGR